MTEPRPAVRPGRVLLPLVLGTALSQMGNPTHTAEARIALASVGILCSANRAIRLLFNGPIGLACDRWPGRRLFAPALWTAALTRVVYDTTRGCWPLLLARPLWGLAWSAVWVGGTTLVLGVATATGALGATRLLLGTATAPLAGVSVQTTLPFGTAEDVQEEVQTLISTLGAGGGYILGPSHVNQAGTPPENVVAMFDTALSYYPS